MKKLKILLMILVIINLIFASFLVADIQLFESPEITINIDVLDVNSEEIKLGSRIEISNPNGFDLIVSDLEILSKTRDGKDIGSILIEGGKIPPNSQKSFNSTDEFGFQSNDFGVIESTVSTVVGVNILGFITKTVPLKITAIASVEKLIDEIIPPDVHIDFKFDKVIRRGINFSASIDIYNPTGFEFNIDTLILDILTEEKEIVGEIEVHGSTISPKSSEVFSSKGLLEFDALDAETLWINVSGIAGVKVAGISKNISFSADTAFQIPKIKSFIFENDSITVSLPVQFKFTLNGLLGTVGFKMYNPSEVPLVGENIVCSISRLDGEQNLILGSEEMQTCNLTPHKTICIKTQILIPYLDYLFSGSGKILPDWIILTIEGGFSIAGTRQSFPVSISAYVDPHFMRNSEFVVPEG